MKCRERSRQSVWWPRLSTQIEEMIADCPICTRTHYNNAEPLLPTSLPDLRWQMVATDLYVRKEHTYILVVDYYSRYIETALLRDTTSQGVIQQLKSIFARHGIPEQVMSDNGPQFSSEAFTNFAKTFDFTHVTSSPHFPQSNGEAERAVKTMKNLLEKADDPYLAILAYRSTPLRNGYSPAELLMNRRLRSNIPIIRDLLKPCVSDLTMLKKVEKQGRNRMKEYHDRRHSARDLPCLDPGARVWVPDQMVYDKVIERSESTTPRSYMIETPTNTIRRNRRHLNHIPDAVAREKPPEEQHVPPQQEEQPVPSQQVSPSREHPEQSPGGLNKDSVVLRSGRISKPPIRLDL